MSQPVSIVEIRSAFSVLVAAAAVALAAPAAPAQPADAVVTSGAREPALEVVEPAPLLPHGDTLPPADTLAPLSVDVEGDGPSLALDAGIWVAGTAGFALVHPQVGRHMFPSGWTGNVWKNVRDPVGRMTEKPDNDPFFTNYVSHPVTWGGIAYYMKARGHSDLTALLFTQGHSLLWEFVIEGSYYPPSGKDMVTNLVSPLAVIHVLHPLLTGDGDERPAAGERSLREPSGATVTVRPSVSPSGFDRSIGLGVRVRH